MKKFTIVEKGEFKRTYEVEAETAEKAMEIIYQGEVKPDHYEEDCVEATCFDENENVVEV